MNARWSVALVGLAVMSSGAAKEKPADLLVTGANVITVDPAQPRAEAVAVRDGRIVFVGTAKEAAALKGPSTNVLNVKGATVVPGLVDAHAHLASLGESLESLRFQETTSWQQVVDATAARAKKAKKGSWILGEGWDQNDWTEKAFPTHAKLTAATPDHPVFLSRIDGHAAIVNAKTLALAGIGKDTADPPGGRIERGADGVPTGDLSDDAMDLVTKHIPSPSLAEVKAHVLRAQAECFRHGLTGMHDAGVGALGLQAYEELLRENKLDLRVYAMLSHSDELLEKRFAAGPVVGDRLTVRSVKVYADGALGSRGAALLAPYADDAGNSGLLRLDADGIQRVTEKALKAGFQVNVHAIGDRGNRAALDGFEKARYAVPEAADPRLRIEHAQVVALDDIPRFAKLGVIASMQPTHATSDMYWAEARVGPERVKGAYAWRRLLDAGARLAGGSDFPVEGVPPLWGIYAAVTRQDHKGWPDGGWRPEERLTAMEALQAFTLGAAYAAFEEKDAGSITVGKRGDLTILSKDVTAIPPREILATEVVATVVGGKVVYRRPAK